MLDISDEKLTCISNELTEEDLERRIQGRHLLNGMGQCGEVLLDIVTREIVLKMNSLFRDTKTYSLIDMPTDVRSDVEARAATFLQEPHRLHLSPSACRINREKQQIQEYENAVISVCRDQLLILLCDATVGKALKKNEKARRLRKNIITRHKHTFISSLNVLFWEHDKGNPFHEFKIVLPWKKHVERIYEHAEAWFPSSRHLQ